MTTQTKTTKAGDFQALYRVCGGGELAFPLSLAELLDALRVVELHANERIVELFWGGLQDSWTAGEAGRLVRLLIDRPQPFYMKFPSRWDCCKPSAELAGEVAEYLRESPRKGGRALATMPAAELLTLLAAATIPAHQQLLLEVALARWGLQSRTIRDYATPSDRN